MSHRCILIALLFKRLFFFDANFPRLQLHDWLEKSMESGFLLGVLPINYGDTLRKSDSRGVADGAETAQPRRT